MFTSAQASIEVQPYGEPKYRKFEFNSNALAESDEETTQKRSQSRSKSKRTEYTDANQGFVSEPQLLSY